MTDTSLCTLLPDIIRSTLTHDALRYALGAGGVYLCINVALQHRLRHRKIRDQTPGWPQIRREILVSLRTVLIFALTGICISVAKVLDLVPIYEDIATYGVAYAVASTLLIIVAHDAWFYWTHRMMHWPPLFRRLHRLHHRSHVPTAFTSYSFDTGEAVINAIFLPLFVAIVPMHPLPLLIFVIHMMLRNAIGHCGVEIFPARADGRPLFGWLSTVTHHDLHHAHAGYNLGLYFTWWDRWMGTEHPNYGPEFARVSRGRGAVAAVMLGLMALLPVPSSPAHAQSQTLQGTYVAPGLAMVVRFAPCGQRAEPVCGELLWGWDPALFRHVQPGQPLLRDLTRTGAGWTGHMTHPETGIRFRGTIERRAGGALALRGCAGPLCQRQIWQPLQVILAELHSLR